MDRQLFVEAEHHISPSILNSIGSCCARSREAPPSPIGQPNLCRDETLARWHGASLDLDWNECCRLVRHAHADLEHRVTSRLLSLVSANPVTEQIRIDPTFTGNPGH